MTHINYEICNHREIEYHKEKCYIWIKICLRQKGHKGEHDYSYSPYKFKLDIIN